MTDGPEVRGQNRKEVARTKPRSRMGTRGRAEEKTERDNAGTLDGSRERRDWRETDCYRLPT